ncbi:hypothetical protein RRG08_048751 [Elysia crispata]|uniref:Uncharacterized protein n=1 Tax=Elysia crispata TaxID=231223 RepID=A0AAE0YZA0_9GAST|nr:hypothetical protein RRG08_048751 [Elysia crispata]
MEIERQETEVLHREEVDIRQSDGDRKTGGRSSAQRGSRQQTKWWSKKDRRQKHREEADNRQSGGVRKTGGRSTERK